jgi:hypothetical protein
MPSTGGYGNLCLLQQRGPFRLANKFITLIEASVQESRNACIRSRFALLKRNDFGLGAQGVTDEHGLGHDQFIIAQIGHQRAERRIPHRQPHHQRESEGAVYDNLPKLAGFGCLRINMQLLRVMRHDRKQQIVRLGHRASNFVGDAIALPLVEIFACH